MQTSVDVVIIGAGASGLMCALTAGQRKRKVLVIEKANKAGKKILMSGGGRCNFTNYSIEPENFISHNPHFCKSALSRYTQWDFLALIDQYEIAFHEREHGQLFCDNSAADILNMLLSECKKNRVDIQLNTSIFAIQYLHDHYQVQTNQGTVACDSLVIGTGGLSIPKMGATPFGYQIAEQFKLKTHKTVAGLVPFTLQPEQKLSFSSLPGIAVAATISNARQSFTENLLFTHRGLSGPVILQISSYWKPGETLTINLLPYINLLDELKQWQQCYPKKNLKTVLNNVLPKRLLEIFISEPLLNTKLAELNHQKLDKITKNIQALQLKPNATEGYRTAEVTVGGVDCDELSSKTMQCIKQPGLFFIGEVLDVTGWLGGYNFQWAWSSGWCAGQYV